MNECTTSIDPSSYGDKRSTLVWIKRNVRNIKLRISLVD